MYLFKNYVLLILYFIIFVQELFKKYLFTQIIFWDSITFLRRGNLLFPPL